MTNRITQMGAVIGGIALMLTLLVWGHPVTELFGSYHPDTLTIIWHLRAPQIVMAILVGASLAFTGQVFQSLFGNPLADPYLLGVSGGAALGHVLGLAIGLSESAQMGLAFVGAGLSLMFVLSWAMSRVHLDRTVLLLAGVMLNAVCFALIMLIFALTDLSQHPPVMNVLMGGIEALSWPKIGVIALACIPVWIMIYRQHASLDVMSLGGEQAQVTGVNVRINTLMITVLSAWLMAWCVSWCGLIGFVGLVVPHAVRLFAGFRHRATLGWCLWAGAIFLPVCDFVSRRVQWGHMTPIRLPVGVLTTLIGAPLFLVLLRQVRERNSA